MSEKLQEAIEFQNLYSPRIPVEEKPAFHVTGGIGWINDPNGFSCYKGEYHLFYQYHPYSTHWGPMHWGHVKTKDFITWEQLPVAIAPDCPADKDGCFSGSAVEAPDGQQALIYTGVTRARDADGHLQDFQCQCVAFGDGETYEKYEYNPVIDGTMVPEGNSIYDFRDPKVWKDGDEYFMVVGNRTADTSGAILLYKSRDLKKWEFCTVLDQCSNQYGKMWECPDFFQLDGTDVLITSPQEMTPIGLEFHAGYNTLAILGNYDKETYRFERRKVQAIDYGIDFYAAQTLLTPDGRRIMIAWMQNWATSNCQPADCRWFGSMTLPRELHVRNGRLIQYPVKELENYRTRQYVYNDVLVSRETNLYGVSGRMLDMEIHIRPVADKSCYHWFRINLCKDGEHCTVISCKPEKGTIRIDRTRCGGRFDIVHVRDIPVNIKNGDVKIRIVMDRFSVEVFVNDGEQAATFQVFAPQSASAISFEADEAALIDVKKYDLKF